MRGRGAPGDYRKTMSQIQIGDGSYVSDGAAVGQNGGDGAERTVIGENATIRSGSVIYSGVEIGDDFTTGHGAIVREETIAGDDVVVGTNAVVDGQVTLGSHVSLQTGAYVPPGSTLGNQVFLGPHAVVTNDEYPIRTDNGLQGAQLSDHVSVGANATILPDVTVGRGSFVAAGSVVTEDVPSETLAVGSPAQHRPLPEELKGGNQIA